MAFIADPSLNEVYNFGSNGTITILNGRPIQLNKSSVDSTDAFYVNVTGGTGRAGVFTGNVMVGPTSAVGNGKFDVAVDGANSEIVSTAYGTGSMANFRGRSARGTMASPTASQSGDVLAAFSARGYGTTGFASTSTGRYGIYASENWTDTAQGTNIQLETTTNGTTTRLVRSIITHDGRIVIGATESSGVPALKASGNTLQVKLGDDSAFASLTGLTLTGNTSVVGGNVTLSSGNVTGSSFLNLIATTGALDVNTQAAQPVTISTSGTLRWTFNASGHVLANTDNTLDIGASGVNRPRTGYFGTSLVVDTTSTLTGTSLTGAGAFGVQATSATLTLTATGANPVQFATNGANQWNISGAGHILANTDNTNDIGASGATRPRTGYFGTSVEVAGNVTVSTGNVSSTGNAGAFFVGSSTNSVNVNLKAAGTTSAILVGGTDSVYLATGAGAATTRWQVDANGHFLGGSDNAYDIGTTGTTNRIRNLYAGTKLWVGDSAGVRSTIDASGNFYTSGQNEHIGTTTAHSLFIDTNNTARWEFLSTGHLQAGADNTYDIGGTASNNPRSIYAGTSFLSPLFSNAAALSITTTAGNGNITLDPNGTGVIALAADVTTTGKVTNYSGVATAGWGIPAVYASGRATAQTAAVTSVATYTVGASDGTFEVAANVLVTASTTHNFTVAVDYTDESNTARSVALPIWDVDTASFNTNGQITDAASGTGVYYGIPLKLRCKSATSITVKTTGTFTSVTYNVEADIKQVA